ncbi:hypothetical protein MDS_3749 [Ectopseudomonas mendocina NK-01]|nr:hypothetical protein MDS_3749 [Pseudomonas mendocina NK-01]
MADAQHGGLPSGKIRSAALYPATSLHSMQSVDSKPTARLPRSSGNAIAPLCSYKQANIK